MHFRSWGSDIATFFFVRIRFFEIRLISSTEHFQAIVYSDFMNSLCRHFEESNTEDLDLNTSLFGKEGNVSRKFSVFCYKENDDL
jgi:hypothetical protein